MKQKVMLYTLLLLFTIVSFGCFSIAKKILGCEEKTKPPKEAGTITFVQGPRYVIQYQYQRQLRRPNWWYHWWYDTGGRCWWLDYNYTPADWPRPKLEHPPRVLNPIIVLKSKPIIERRTMIPRDAKDGIDRYVDNGIPTGSFLRAVLSNDLFEAVARADYRNKLALTAICEYIYNYTPRTCFGSPEEVEAWMKYHRENPKEANRAAGMDRVAREHYYK